MTGFNTNLGCTRSVKRAVELRVLLSNAFVHTVLFVLLSDVGCVFIAVVYRVVHCP